MCLHDHYLSMRERSWALLTISETESLISPISSVDSEDDSVMQWWTRHTSEWTIPTSIHDIHSRSLLLFMWMKIGMIHGSCITERTCKRRKWLNWWGSASLRTRRGTTFNTINSLHAHHFRFMANLSAYNVVIIDKNGRRSFDVTL